MASKNTDSYGEFSKADTTRGYRILSVGYKSVCDPDRDGDMDYGSTYEGPNDCPGGEMARYKPDEDPPK